jgi:hypothetical protein
MPISVVSVGCRMRIYLCAFLLALPTAAGAQLPDSLKVRELMDRAWRGDWHVRVTMESDSVQGRVRAVSDSLGRIGGVYVRHANVQTMERRTRQPGYGLRLGLIGGLVGGFMLCGYPCDAEFGVFFFGGGFLGGLLVGTIAGNLAKPPTTIWTPLWPDSIGEAHRRVPDTAARAGIHYR